MKKLIFFDLDGTLTPMKTWYLFNKTFGLTDEEDEALFKKYLEKSLDYETWMKDLTSLLRDRGLCTKEAVDDFANLVELRPGAKELVDDAIDKGYMTIVLSGAISQIAEKFALRLGIEKYFGGAQIDFDENGKLKDLIKGRDEALSKLRTFESICAEHGVDPSETIMVGDGGNDLEIFKRTNKAIQIGDYEPLKKHAWKHVENLIEIKELI